MGSAKHYFDDLQYHTVRNMILDEGRRLDGRKTDEGAWPCHGDRFTARPPHVQLFHSRGKPKASPQLPLGTSEDELL